MAHDNPKVCNLEDLVYHFLFKASYKDFYNYFKNLILQTMGGI